MATAAQISPFCPGKLIFAKGRQPRLVFGSSAPRYATVGVAKDYRLVFERECRIPQDTDSQRLPGDVLGFLLDALTIALSEDMPPAAASSCTRRLKSSASWRRPS